MPDRPAFQDKQYALAAHIRDPQSAPAPAGVEERRIAIYRELFFNNLRSLLGKFFPVLRKVHDVEDWNRFIRQFMQKHRAKTPYFLELPQEFLAFLENEYEPQPDDYPFLLELAHYEYVELALSISTATNDFADIDPDGDLLAGVPVKSELAWSYAYHYPVHRIAPDFLPDVPLQQPLYIAVYRRSDDKVAFLELNAVTAKLLAAIEGNASARTGAALLRDIAAEIGYDDTDAFLQHGAAALEEMRELEILIGTRRN